MTRCGAIALLAAFFAIDCGSSLVEPEEKDAGILILDGGGIEDVDASDDRDLPSSCGSNQQCDDGDPCTVESCNGSVCSFESKEISIAPVLVKTKAPAVDVALAQGFMYVAEGSSGVERFDIANPAIPKSMTLIPTAGEAIAVDADERGLVVAEGKGGVETFAQPRMSLSAHLVPGDEGLPGAEEITDVTIGPGYSIASAYDAGAYIIDLTNLGNPLAIACVDTAGRVVGASCPDKSFCLLADSLGGAAALLLQTEEMAGSEQTKGRVVAVAAVRDTGLIAEYGFGFGVLDLSDPNAPQRLATVRTYSPVVSVSLLGAQTGVVVERRGMVHIYDFRNPFKPALLATWKAGTEAFGSDALSGLIAVALGEAGVALLGTGCSP